MSFFAALQITVLLGLLVVPGAYSNDIPGDREREDARKPPLFELSFLSGGTQKDSVSVDGVLDASAGSAPIQAVAIKVLDGGLSELTIQYRILTYGQHVDAVWETNGGWLPRSTPLSHLLFIGLRLKGSEADRYELRYQTWASMAGRDGANENPAVRASGGDPGAWSGDMETDPASTWVSRIRIEIRPAAAVVDSRTAVKSTKYQIRAMVEAGELAEGQLIQAHSRLLQRLDGKNAWLAGLGIASVVLTGASATINATTSDSTFRSWGGGITAALGVVTGAITAYLNGTGKRDPSFDHANAAAMQTWTQAEDRLSLDDSSSWNDFLRSYRAFKTQVDSLNLFFKDYLPEGGIVGVRSPDAFVGKRDDPF